MFDKLFKKDVLSVCFSTNGGDIIFKLSYPSHYNTDEHANKVLAILTVCVPKELYGFVYKNLEADLSTPFKKTVFTSFENYVVQQYRTNNLKEDEVCVAADGVFSNE